MLGNHFFVLLQLAALQLSATPAESARRATRDRHDRRDAPGRRAVASANTSTSIRTRSPRCSSSTCAQRPLPRRRLTEADVASVPSMAKRKVRARPPSDARDVVSVPPRPSAMSAMMLMPSPDPPVSRERDSIETPKALRSNAVLGEPRASVFDDEQRVSARRDAASREPRPPSGVCRMMLEKELMISRSSEVLAPRIERCPVRCRA